MLCDNSSSGSHMASGDHNRRGLSSSAGEPEAATADAVRATGVTAAQRGVGNVGVGQYDLNVELRAEFPGLRYFAHLRAHKALSPKPWLNGHDEEEVKRASFKEISDLFNFCGGFDCESCVHAILPDLAAEISSCFDVSPNRLEMERELRSPCFGHR